MPEREKGIPEEHIPKEEEKLTVEELRRQREELEKKIEEAKAQKQKDIEQKLTDREILLAEAKRIDDLWREAQETLEYYSTMRALGELKDPSDIQRLEELKTLVRSLENQLRETINRIDSISRHPEIGEKLHEEAEQVDKKQRGQKIVEKAHEQLNPQIDKLAQAVKDLSDRKLSLWKQIESQEKIVHSNWRKISDLVTRVKDQLSEKSDFGYTLDDMLSQSQTPAELKQRLVEARKSLGIFKGKEKAAIDFILSGTQEFEDLNQSRESLQSLRQSLEQTKSEEEQLAKQYKDTIMKSWEAQNEADELTGGRGLYYVDLQSDFSFRLEHQIEDFAGLKRGPGQKGKYESWSDASQKEPANSTLYATWKNVTEKAGGYDLIYNNPKGKKGE